MWSVAGLVVGDGKKSLRVMARLGNGCRSPLAFIAEGLVSWLTLGQKPCTEGPCVELFLHANSVRSTAMKRKLKVWMENAVFREF